MRMISFLIRSDSAFRMMLRFLDTFFSKLRQWEQKAYDSKKRA